MDKTMIDAPCKGCEMAGCGPYHDQCTKYQAYKESVNRYKKHRMGALDKKDYITKAVARMKGRK